ncbi:MAG: phosphodiester glycosidase family protein [Deltaproteobacteria bacterium]|nr:phosphodiester glycosidase family protein [Deltaproteobacteria bacterium]
MKTAKIIFLIAAFALFSSKGNSIDCTPPSCTKTELKKGVIWYHKTYSNLLGGPQDVNIIDIDNNDPHIVIKPVYKSSSSCERTSSMGKRTGALAGVNGGFFDSGSGCTPLGLLKIDNKVISYAVSYRPPRSAVGIALDKTIIFRRTGSNDPFPEAIHALGGMPNLVKDGKKYVTITEEQAESIAGLNPRTAICKTPNNHFLMITVDGRATNRTGMTLDDLAQYLLWLGCSDGINLDGGGSTTMWINQYGVVNHPSDGTERYVSNGLFVYYIDNLPPVIEHTPIKESAKMDIVIKARVTDDNGLKAVNLKFRNKGDISFVSRSMIDKGNDIFEGTIYTDEIKTDLIQYYIAAWDGTLRTVLPADAETNNVYFEISIKNYYIDAGHDENNIGEEIPVHDVAMNNDVTEIKDVFIENDIYSYGDSIGDWDDHSDAERDYGYSDYFFGDTEQKDSTQWDTSFSDLYDVHGDDSSSSTSEDIQLIDHFLPKDIGNLADIKGDKEIGSPLLENNEQSGCSCGLVE